MQVPPFSPLPLPWGSLRIVYLLWISQSQVSCWDLLWISTIHWDPHPLPPPLAAEIFACCCGPHWLLRSVLCAAIHASHWRPWSLLRATYPSVLFLAALRHSNYAGSFSTLWMRQDRNSSLGHCLKGWKCWIQPWLSLSQWEKQHVEGIFSALISADMEEGRHRSSESAVFTHFNAVALGFVLFYDAASS